MKDGSYRYSLEMTVPLGKRNGSLEIRILGKNMIGFLTMFTDTQPITCGICTGNGISFQGEMKTLAETIHYIAEGTISQSQIQLVFHTERGDYPASGRPALSDQRRAAGQ